MKRTALQLAVVTTLTVLLPLGLLAGPGGPGKGPRWRGGRGAADAGGAESRGAQEACGVGCGGQGSCGGPGGGAGEQGTCWTIQDGEGEGTLTTRERDHLLSLREEERAARDLYAVFAEAWDLQIFSNIGSSEVRHMAAIKGLLDRYGLDDPSAGRAPGSYADPRLQSAYLELVQRGKQSLPEALEAGARFEEIDIQDLQTALDATERTDLERVFGNLQRASRNHLRAFTGQLEHRNISRTAQHPEPDALKAIVSDGHERGGQAP